MSSPSKVTTPVEAGKVGVFYDATSKVISHFAAFPAKGNIITGMPVLIADNDEALKTAIAAIGLIERPSTTNP
jgi:hypothetical protein